jgi:hypothetical protein
MGWCPHFEERPILSTPFSDLPLSGKMVFSTLIGTTGLLAIIAAILMIPQYMAWNLPWSGFLIFSNILNLVAGLMIIVLLVDFFTKGILLRRHKLEASCILSLWGGQQIISLLYVFWLYNNLGLTLTQTLSSAALGLTSATLYIYASYRLFSDKAILVKQTFLLLSIYFITPIIDPYIVYLLDADWRQNATLATEFGVATSLIAYAVAGYFFFRTYLAARSQNGFTLKIPLYIVADLFVYGASQTILGFYYTFVNPTNLAYNVMGLSYSHGAVIALVQSVMFLLASFYICKLDLGAHTRLTSSSRSEYRSL